MARGASFDAAIVGGGACGLAVLLQLLDRAPSGARIVIFEKAKATGPGLAYSPACAGTHINMHASTMSLLANDPNHFVRWINKNPCTFSNRIDFPSREHYGKYLSELAASTKELASSRGIELVTVEDEVVDVVSQTQGWSLHLASGSILESSSVALALGNSTPIIHKQLMGNPFYFENPWPNQRLLTIPKTASVCLLGSRLTAIDEALYLVANGHTGPIALASRTGQLPKVQGTAKKYERVFALHNLAKELEESGKKGGIITIAKRIHDEMRLGAKKGRSFASLLTDTDDFTAQFRTDVEVARKGFVPGQDVLRATAPIIERYWRCLDEESQQAFLREYMSEWVIHRHAMPLHTAEKVLRLLESGQLRLVQVERREPVRFDEERKAFAVPTAKDGTAYYDAFVEATGIEYDATKIETKLMKNLLARKTLRPHAAGGVHVDFDTLEAAKGLFVLGSMTRGVHFYSTAIDRNVAHAERLADGMLGLMPRKSLHVALFGSSDAVSQTIIGKIVPQLVAKGHVPFVYLAEQQGGLQDQDSSSSRGSGSDSDEMGPSETLQQHRTQYGLLVRTVADVNSSDFIRSLSTNHIDLGYSVRCNQRMKSDISSFFEARQGLWNLQPRISTGTQSLLRPTQVEMIREKSKASAKIRQVRDDADVDTLVDFHISAQDGPKAVLDETTGVQSVSLDGVEELTDKISRGREPKVYRKPAAKRDSFMRFLRRASWRGGVSNRA